MRRPDRARCCAALVVAPLAGMVPHAYATEPSVEVTDSTSALYNVDNRNTRPAVVDSLVDDDWVGLYNRLGLRLVTGEWRAGLRVDSAYFPRSPTPVEVGLDAVRRRGTEQSTETDAELFRRIVFQSGRELSNRYLNWTYPAKVFVGYESRDWEATIGDFYAQLGRGLVLSVRRVDELSDDTTIRGVRAARRFDLGSEGSVELGLLAGSLNPLRIDEASGRTLGVTAEVTPGLHRLLEAGMPRAVATDFVPDPTPQYAPDRVVGAELVAKLSRLRLGTQGAVLLRQAALDRDPVRSAPSVTNLSQFLELPRIAQDADAYIEVATQQLGSSGEAERLDPGYAVYGSVGYRPQPLGVLLEAKHYRRFFPLRANVDLSSAREYASLAYSSPPTTLPVWADTEFGDFATCTSGGRAKVDVALSASTRVEGWIGRYVSYAESVSNPSCAAAPETRNDAWDAATGFETHWDRRVSHARLTLGGRLDEAGRDLPSAEGGTTRLFYREEYARYDLTARLLPRVDAKLQGWHRHRAQTVGGADEPYFEGEHVTGLAFASGLGVAVGVEYDTNPQTPPTYLNAQLRYAVGSTATLALFLGQRRGSLRCVAGVCRTYPPFSGVRLDSTLQF